MKLKVLMLFVMLATLGLAGCEDNIQSVAQTLVNRYCAKEPTQRQLLRAVVAEAIAPNEIAVVCFRDQAEAAAADARAAGETNPNLIFSSGFE